MSKAAPKSILKSLSEQYAPPAPTKPKRNYRPHILLTLILLLLLVVFVLRMQFEAGKQQAMDALQNHAAQTEIQALATQQAAPGG